MKRRNYPEAFERFWSVWQPVCRESDGKPKAFTTWKSHVESGADPDDITEAAKGHIRKRREANSLAYIQLASSWLNAERYEFEAQEHRDFQKRLQEAEERRRARLNGDNVVAMR